MNVSNITTVPKKGSRLQLKNERGIFRVPVIRSILMKMIYNSNYPEIDANMSDCQMGGRRGKGCRNNIFILNGIIHEILKSKKKQQLIFQIYDYAQMFDSINLKEAISDIYDYGFKNDMLTLVYKANVKTHMAVNTTHGLTERQTVENTVLQGDTFGSILASVQVNTIGKYCEKSGYGYKYKNKLSIPILGLVDDIIGISEVGFKAQQMNAIINVKTAEKGLRFGPLKCKTMVIGGDTRCGLGNDFTVDNWIVEHVTDTQTEETKLKESYDGKIPIDSVQQQKYLGFVISNSGDNLANIMNVKKKSIGIIRKILEKLNGLKLKEYYFECGIILMNVILRGSILYAAECYYDLKEKELRIIERIEEGFMRKLLKTTAGCPIVQLYLELGQIPARYQIMKLRILFLKSMLHEKEDSRISLFLKLQLEESKKGDWISTCMADLKYLSISESLEGLKKISRNQFRKMIDKKIREKAFDYLKSKQKKKGSDIKYTDFEMSEYLMPNDLNIDIESQQYLFSIRNGMVNIPANYGSESQCICGEKEIMEHIYSCEKLNFEKEEVNFEKVYTGTQTEQIKILKRFRSNMEKRTKLKTIIPCDRISDPLISDLEISSGNE